MLTDNNEPMKLTLVVGNKFQDFRKSKANVILASELEVAMAMGGDQWFIPGQGLSEDETTSLIVRLSPENKAFINSLKDTRRADQQSTHKHKKENILISEPKPVGANSYLSDLNVDDACAEMSDHTTGQHLQGMLLVEAFRQMLVTVTEKYLLPKNRRFKYGFVFDSFDVRFLEFGFPGSARVKLEVLDSKSQGEVSFQYRVRVQVIQNGQSICEVGSKYSVMVQDYLLMKEEKMAKKALAEEMEQLWRKLPQPAVIGVGA